MCGCKWCNTIVELLHGDVLLFDGGHNDILVKRNDGNNNHQGCKDEMWGGCGIWFLILFIISW